jgi:hypothetical protein
VNPFRYLREREAARVAWQARIRAANERAREQTRRATVETGGNWPDGRWERTRWENGAPVRTYRGTRARPVVPDAPRARTRGR